VRPITPGEIKALHRDATVLSLIGLDESSLEVGFIRFGMQEQPLPKPSARFRLGVG
jgi:hypothetical protein